MYMRMLPNTLLMQGKHTYCQFVILPHCPALTIGRAKIAMTTPAKAMRNMNRIIARIVTPIVARTVSPAMTEFSMMS